jgi:hypothetical protein
MPQPPIDQPTLLSGISDILLRQIEKIKTVFAFSSQQQCNKVASSRHRRIDSYFLWYQNQKGKSQAYAQVKSIVLASGCNALK